MSPNQGNVLIQPNENGGAFHVGLVYDRAVNGGAWRAGAVGEAAMDNRAQNAEPDEAGMEQELLGEVRDAEHPEAVGEVQGVGVQNLNNEYPPNTRRHSMEVARGNDGEPESGPSPVLPAQKLTKRQINKAKFAANQALNYGKSVLRRRK